MAKLVDALGQWLAAECKDGLPGHFGDEIVQQFSSSPKADLEDALAELEENGLVMLSHVLGPALPRVGTTYELFRVYDPEVTGNHPEKDAVTLAQFLLEDPKLAAIASLHEKSGWSPRRFNPALGQLMPLFDPGRFSESLQNEYPTRWLIVDAKERVRLKAFIEHVS